MAGVTHVGDAVSASFLLLREVSKGHSDEL
jgi:hypothetical protein